MLEDEYNASVNINIVDPSELKFMIDDVKILSPNNITTAQIAEELESENKILIIEDFATEHGLEAGDTILVRFRLFSDPYANGWGWAIDNLRIQIPVSAPVAFKLLPKKVPKVTNQPPQIRNSRNIMTDSRICIDLFIVLVS